MSYYDYRAGQEIEYQDYSFAAIIQAAMRRADSINVLLLHACWPEIWEDFQARYHAPGGLLDGEAATRSDAMTTGEL